MALLDVIVPRILLGLEICISVAAVVHFEHARLGSLASSAWDGEACSLDLQGGQCLADTLLETTQIPEEKLLNSGLAIGALSLIVVVARIVMMRLKYSPRYTNIFYDMLLCFLWVATTTNEIIAISTTSDANHISISLSLLLNECDATKDGSRDSCQTARASLIIPALAALLYAGRLVVEAMKLATLAFGPKSRADRMTIRSVGRYHDTEASRDMEVMDTTEKVYSDAMSPVLAFFPEDV